MPWTKENPPAVAKNWTADEIARCVAAANAVIARDPQDDATAIFACISAAGKSHRKEASMPTGNEILSDIKELSYDQLRSAISNALNPRRDNMAMPMMNMEPYRWVREFYGDRVIVEVECEGKSKLYEIGYTVGADDAITFADPVEVEVTYTPKPAQGGKAEAEDEKAVLTAAQLNKMPESDFAYIDAEGGRHLPIHDEEHVRAAMARFNQTQFESDDAKKKAHAKMIAAARRMGMEVSEESAKAGQRMQGKMKDMLQAMSDGMGTMMGKIKDMMSWANYEDAPAADAQVDAATNAKADDLAIGFKVYRDKAGKLRWLSRSANAFKDREGEIFKTKALENAVEEADKSNDRGPLMLWHVKGTEFGTCDFQAVIGRFLIESGTFDETPPGKKAADYFNANSDTPFEVSIGYEYKTTDRTDAVYDWVAIRERSVTPPDAAMNPWTAFTTIKEAEQMALNETKKAFLEGVFGAEFVADLATKAEEDSKALEKKLDFKADESEQFDLKAMAVTLGEQIKPLVDGIKATAESMASMQAEIKAQADRLVKIESDRKAEAEKAANAPRIAGLYTQRVVDTAPEATKEEAEKASLEALGTANPNHPLNRPVGISR